MNKCHFTGNLCADPEFRTTPSGVSVVRFRLAVNRPFRRGTERTKEVAFLPMEAWDKGADLIAKHFKKGSHIIITDASVKQEEWEDRQTGKKMSKLVFRVNEFEFPQGNGRTDDDQPSGDDPAPAPAPTEGEGGGDQDAIPF